MTFKRMLRYMAVVLIILQLLAVSVHAVPQATTSVGSEELPYESYTYWQEFGSEKKTAVYCKPMYKVKTVINADSIGVNEIEEISDICSDNEGRLYLLDCKASIVYVLDKEYHLISKIDNVSYKGKKQSFIDAKGIFVKDGFIYISDTENNRVLIFDIKGKVKKIVSEPDSKLIPDDFKYRPIKVAVDSKNFMYIACDGSYYGALVYSPDMEFLGFYGANTVKATVLDVLQNIADKLFSNDTKKESSVLALPYQFTDMVVGSDDFIYTATGKTGGDNPSTGQISMMNPGGKNILKGEDINYLDNEVGIYKGVVMSQDVAGIDVDSDGFFYLIDSTLGRVFWYDTENNPICVFGGSLYADNQKGTFSSPNAIALSGTDVAVSDALKDSVTVFEITEYGSAVRKAQLKTLCDDFETTIDDWESIIKEDKNNQLAYRGIAKGYYTVGENKKALEYAKLGADRDTYSSAFEKIRQSFLEKWFSIIFVAIILFLAVIVIVSMKLRKRKKEIIKNTKIKVFFSSIIHPVESFRLVKEKKQGSVIIATIVLAIFYILSAISDTANGFAFNYFDAANYNSFYIFLSTAGLVLLWTVSNWLVCVLMGGIGKLKEIFIVTVYGLIPTVLGTFTGLILSHILVPDEFVFVTILQTVCVLYSVFMIIVGLMRIHDFEFGKFLFTTFLTFIAMIIVVFLIFLMFLLTQQLVGWIQTLFIEIKYR